jgi:hypothetical protein
MPKSKAARELKMKYWVFFTPSAYNLISFSFFIVSIIIFGIIMVYSFLRMFHNSYLIFLFILSTVIVISIFKKLYVSLKYYETTKNFTFYDMFMREY